MKFNQNTVSVLKNFSTINSSIMMREGNVLKTISPHKSVMAIATLDQDLEGNAAVYDLPRFLSTISLFDNPEVLFNENRFVITDGKSKVNYTYAAESMILTPDNKEVKMSAVDVDTVVTWSDFEKVMKASSVLKLPHIAFIGDENGIRLAAIDASNPTADTFDITLNDTPQQKNYKFVFRTENLKMIPNDYDVKISSKGVSKFSNERVTYFVVIEPKFSN